MLEKLTKFVGKYPKIVITVIILLTVFFYLGLEKINITGKMEEMLPKDEPVRVAFDDVDNTFGGAEFAMIILDMGEVFTAGALREVDRLTLNMEKLKGVNSVLSITLVKALRKR